MSLLGRLMVVPLLVRFRPLAACFSEELAVSFLQDGRTQAGCVKY